jgi:hypothetical protein
MKLIEEASTLRVLKGLVGKLVWCASGGEAEQGVVSSIHIHEENTTVDLIFNEGDPLFGENSVGAIPIHALFPTEMDALIYIKERTESLIEKRIGNMVEATNEQTN